MSDSNQVKYKFDPIYFLQPYWQFWVEVCFSNRLSNRFDPGLSLFSIFLKKKMYTTTVLTLRTSGLLQTGRYVELTALMLFFQLSMMCRHLIFYPNLDRNDKKTDVSPDSLILPWLWVIRQKLLLFWSDCLKNFCCNMLWLRGILEEFICHMLFSTYIHKFSFLRQK